MALISIVIPTYNRLHSLVNCLERLNEGFQNFSKNNYEVIVSDDSTNDFTSDHLKTNFPTIKYFRGPQKGPASNRNYGASKANGEWLLFTDDDCLPEEMWINSYFTAIINNPTCLVFEGKTISKIGLKSPLDVAPINETGGYLWSCNFAISKNFFDELGGFNIHFPFAHMEDVELKKRIDDYKTKILFIENAIIDHPPRKISSPENLAKQHESEFFYFKKFANKQGNLLPELLKNIIRFRIKNILNYPISIDSMRAFSGMLIEIYFTAINYPKWVRKYFNT